jgi:hypothetical protein
LPTSGAPHVGIGRLSLVVPPTLSCGAGAIREISIGLGCGLVLGAGWKVYHSNERFLVAQANKSWIDRKAELRAKAAKAAEA